MDIRQSEFFSVWDQSNQVSTVGEEEPRFGRDRPLCRELVNKLRTHLNYHWITSDSGHLWELRSVFQADVQSPDHFAIGITLFANYNGDARLNQHAIYLVLEYREDRFRLDWAPHVVQSMPKIQMAFGNIYPIEYFVADILACAAPFKVQVDIPLKAAPPMSRELCAL